MKYSFNISIFHNKPKSTLLFHVFHKIYEEWPHKASIHCNGYPYASTLSTPLTPMWLVVDEILKVVGVIFYVVEKALTHKAKLWQSSNMFKEKMKVLSLDWRLISTIPFKMLSLLC